jgi:hypothetical protein
VIDVPIPMPLRTSPDASPRYDNSVERRPDPRHIFDRDPLLIPQLFVDMTPPWHSRKRWRLAIALSVGAAVTVGTMMVLEGPRAALTTLGHAGVSVMHGYTRLVAGGPG